MLEYYLLLRSVLKTQPQLRRCLKRCWHCRIFFLTDPRNAGRQKLGCPFGCKEVHRKRESTRRSVKYYQDPKGKKKKQDLNQKRRRSDPLCPPSKGVESRREKDSEPWSEPLVEHVRMVVSLIEGRKVTREQILRMLEKVLRQRRMARGRRIDQIIGHLNQHPP